MTTLLSVTDLHVSYGKIEAVSGVSLAMQTGQIVTVIGPNGAGKTTLLAALMGLLPSKGESRYEGQDLRVLITEERVRRGICLVPERRELFTEMTVADNLVLGAYTRWRDRAAVQRDLQHVYTRFPRLSERRSQLAGTLSGGERQMLALGRALMAKPRLLLLDEPSLGLAPLIVREIFRIVMGCASLASQSCWSSRMRARRSRPPTMATFSKPAVNRSQRPGDRASSTTRASSQAISAARWTDRHDVCNLARAS